MVPPNGAAEWCQPPLQPLQADTFRKGAWQKQNTDNVMGHAERQQAMEHMKITRKSGKKISDLRTI